MNAADALRYIAHEAKQCRDRDTAEAICLLIPVILREVDLEPMDHREAFEFWAQLRERVKRGKVTV